MKKKKKTNDIEKDLDITICPACKYYNQNKYIKTYGKCLKCLTVLDKKADFRYTMIRKLHLFKEGQAGYGLSKDRYK